MTHPEGHAMVSAKRLASLRMNFCEQLGRTLPSSDTSPTGMGLPR